MAHPTRQPFAAIRPLGKPTSFWLIMGAGRSVESVSGNGPPSKSSISGWTSVQQWRRFHWGRLVTLQFTGFNSRFYLFILASNTAFHWCLRHFWVFLYKKCRLFYILPFSPFTWYNDSPSSACTHDLSPARLCYSTSLRFSVTSWPLITPRPGKYTPERRLLGDERAGANRCA